MSYVTAAQKAFDMAMKIDPLWYSVSLGLFEQHRHSPMFEAFHQTPKGMRDPAMWFCWTQFYHGVASGEIDVLHVEVGATPLADKMVKENEAALNAGLNPEFSASVWGGRDGADGVITWDTPLKAYRWFDNGTRLEQVDIAPGGLDLEIGEQLGHKSIAQVGHISQGLARWPYESSTLWMFFVTKERKQRMAAAIHREFFSAGTAITPTRP